ncbi:MAG: tryptophan--tRNA ligase [Candidatus Diapherotrites archaeon]|nr:tryptophan--tRNA ligase [Candidatus Diapherotrites archaeon]
MKLSPWDTIEVKDYSKLFDEFGIQPMFPVFSESYLFRRGIVFGHRDFDKFLEARESGQRVSVLTGIMPSGPMHLGHKMVVDQCVLYQDKGVQTRVLVADVEAMATRGIPEEQARDLAVNEYLLNWVALGLDLKKSDVYAQSNRSVPYYRLAALLSGRVTNAEMTAIYGDLSPAKTVSSLLQSSDILHPQLKEYDGPHNVLVPVGVDQDPHLRLTRGFADKLGLIKPSSTYHRFMSGLDGGKMSSSRPGSYIALNDSTKEALRKVDNALTGGRDTAAEQRKKGGQPERCMVYELLTYHFMPEDKELARIHADCKSGKMLCGECKKILKDRLGAFMDDLRKKREKARPKVKKFTEEMFTC